MQREFKRGDFVKCEYEGKEYIGSITETPKNGIAKVKICLSNKRADKPIFEEVEIFCNSLVYPINSEEE